MIVRPRLCDEHGRGILSRFVPRSLESGTWFGLQDEWLIRKAGAYGGPSEFTGHGPGRPGGAGAVRIARWVGAAEGSGHLEVRVGRDTWRAPATAGRRAHSHCGERFDHLAKPQVPPT